MILSGEKKEEYREFKKYWINRFITPDFSWDCDTIEKCKIHYDACNYGFYEKYEQVTFRNGYAPDAPEMTLKIEGIKLGFGQSNWGAEYFHPYFVISLGEIISTKNIKK